MIFNFDKLFRRYFHIGFLKVILIRSESKNNEGGWWFVDGKWLSLANPTLQWKVGKVEKKFVPMPEAYIHSLRLGGLTYGPMCYVDWETGYPIIFKGQKRVLPATKYGTIINDEMLGSFLSRKEKIMYFIVIVVLVIFLSVSLMWGMTNAIKLANIGANIPSPPP